MPQTSPVASGSGLPCSLVSRRASSVALASMMSAILVMSLRALGDRGRGPGRERGLRRRDGRVELGLDARGH